MFEHNNGGENTRTRNNERYRLLAVADTAIALFLTFPLTCMFWRGIWDLIGYYVLRGQVPLNYWVQASVGILQMVGLLMLPLIQEYLNPDNKVTYWILTRLFMYLHTLTYMFYWHGLWELLNWHLPLSWEYNVATLVISYMCLVFLAGCRSTMWPPFFIAIDEPELFNCANRFGSKAKRGGMLDYISDAFIAQIVVLGTAILCWRSAFNLQDTLLFPVCALLLCLQLPLGWVSVYFAKRKSAFLKVFWEDSVYFITFLFLAFLWRGMWNLNAEYVIKELPLGGWVNHIAGTVGLMAMQTFGEVSAFGMIRDGTDVGGEAFFPVSYLRVFFKDWYMQDPQRTRRRKPGTLDIQVMDEQQLSDGFVNVAFVAMPDVTRTSLPAIPDLSQYSNVECTIYDDVEESQYFKPDVFEDSFDVKF